MRKMMCIIPESGWFILHRKTFFGLIPLPDKPCDGPKYGDIVHVTREYYCKGVLYYDLREWPPTSDDDGFEADCFVPVSDIDETEFERNYKKPETVQ